MQTSISIRPHVILHSEKYFQDAWTFAPERWLSAELRPDKYANDVLFASQLFSFRPTGCIGQSLAWAEMRILLAKLIQRFQFSMTIEKPFRWETVRMMMVVEKGPLWLKLEERDHRFAVS